MPPVLSTTRTNPTLPCLPEVSVMSSNIFVDDLSVKMRANPWHSLTLHQLQQHAARADWVHEYVLMTTGPNLDLLGDKAYAICPQTFHDPTKIRHFHADVVQSLAALGDELCDCRIL